jgi:fructan beta-fructosidase
LGLFEVDGTLLLKSSPAKELHSLRVATYESSGDEVLLPSQAVEIQANIENDELFSLSFQNELGDEIIISKEQGLVNVDRTKAGRSDFHEDFAALHSAPMSWEAKNIRIFLDASSIEVFINDGELVMTSLLFPNSPWKKIKLNGGLEDLLVHQLKKP